MATVSLSALSVAQIKRHLNGALGSLVHSAHLTEAIARGLGFRTHAALQALVRDPSCEAAELSLFNQAAFVDRLRELGYGSALDALSLQSSSTRRRAWRNVLVCAINEAVLRGLLTLQPQHLAPQPAQDRWEKQFEFELPNGLPASVLLRDGGYDEVIVRVAINPKGDIWRVHQAGFEGGDMVASVWLERLTGAWLQAHAVPPHLVCRQHLLPKLARLDVVPLGFQDHGPFIL